MTRNFFLPAALLAGTALFAQQKNSGPQATVFTTAKNTTMRLQQTASLKFTPMPQPLETQPCVFVSGNRHFQEITGIGAALTDASAETFAKLPAKVQQELLTAYFDPVKGIGYTLARTNINSCDFSSGSYTYVTDNDVALKSFNVQHDEAYKIPFIKKAMNVAGKLDLYVSPWSPPAWMKTNNSMLQGGKLKAEFRQTWADYYVKFIHAYEQKGIPVWGLTVQNEPMAKQRWESCIYSAEEERDFVKEYLGPTLVKAGMKDKKLIAWDHNRDLIYQRANTLLSDHGAARYIWGIGFHWYETWTGGNMQFNNLKQVAESFPDKKLVFTEGCIEKFDLARITDWSLGERYGTSMVNDFNNGTVAWTDWNILLDERGGPNHVGNFCFAPIHADTKSGKLLYTNSYYYLGHFSKFVKPGARRIISSSSREQLQTTAFRNPDGSIVVVVLNTTELEIPYHVWMNGTAAPSTSLPHSIATIVIK
ncbi:glycoside hydrolase family 30 beta sandwich domain-containing protein [Parasegetibacter sp. NRK P23]|uniref:glycoside hydrolase family 30 protein n=1 Tax=Parasegetibacter sp. NRK P23 TaxID=2942999 RepID=UPI002044AE56|nr:glycoside hydrolase family 30 protein [Parasegetibacter sp. NRK P23]MCM5530472.1 glycosyl hydrolase [Parasegetibacter sp. NRK P23]